MFGTWVGTMAQESNDDHNDSTFAVQALNMLDYLTTGRSKRHEALLRSANEPSSSDDEEDENASSVLWSFCAVYQDNALRKWSISALESLETSMPLLK